MVVWTISSLSENGFIAWRGNRNLHLHQLPSTYDGRKVLGLLCLQNLCSSSFKMHQLRLKPKFVQRKIAVVLYRYFMKDGVIGLYV